MPLSEMTNIGAYIDFEVGIVPVAYDESPAAGDPGSAIDLQAKDWPASAKLILALGAATGSPTTFVAFAKLQHRESTTASWADYVVRGDDAQTPNVTAANGEASVDIDLSGAKRYVRVVFDVDFTGGSSPTIQAAAILVIGGTPDLPA